MLQDSSMGQFEYSTMIIRYQKSLITYFTFYHLFGVRRSKRDGFNKWI